MALSRELSHVESMAAGPSCSWDRGTWVPEGDAAEAYQQGKLIFRLDGDRLKGRWALIRMGGGRVRTAKTGYSRA